MNLIKQFLLDTITQLNNHHQKIIREDKSKKQKTKKKTPYEEYKWKKKKNTLFSVSLILLRVSYEKSQACADTPLRRQLVIVSHRELDLYERGHIVTHLSRYSMNSSTRAHESKPHMQKQITLEEKVCSCLSLYAFLVTREDTAAAIQMTMKQTFLYLSIWCYYATGL